MNIESLFGVQGKVAIVTGGTRGIGLMIAQGFVENGMTVYISSRKAEVCHEVEKQLNALGKGKCVAIPADLQKDAECKRVADFVSGREKRVHVLVNNAGANWAAPIDKYSSEAFDKVMNLNCKSPFLLTKYCLSLLKGGSLEDPSRVINIGSVNGLAPSSLQTYAYTTSKAAVHMLSKHLAVHLGKHHITVNAVAPGPFQSKMMAATLNAMGQQIAAGRSIKRLGSASDMAGVCLFLCSKAGSYVTGAVIPVDGGGLIMPGAL